MVHKRRLNKIIFCLAEKIQRKYKPEKIILFGSLAWGRADKDSDIDLFIIKKTNQRHIDRAVEVAKILDEENEMFAIEPMVYTPQEVRDRLKMGDPFIKKILEKGQVLYE
jgi:predicted nucleotidyltransferase